MIITKYYDNRDLLGTFVNSIFNREDPQTQG